MPELGERARAQLPDSAFAYIDSRGVRRLPINDEAHVRNALSRFNQVRFEDEAARDRARTRLLKAAKKYGIVPVGFMTGQWRSQSRQAAAGKAVIELGGLGTPEQLEARLRVVPMNDLQLMRALQRALNAKRRKEAIEALENLAAVTTHLKHLLLIRDLRKIVS